MVIKMELQILRRLYDLGFFLAIQPKDIYNGAAFSGWIFLSAKTHSYCQSSLNSKRCI